MKKVCIAHLGNNHSQWLRLLDFHKEEISILKKRLTEIAGKNMAKDITQQLEHFENQFTLQTENIDRLSCDIRQNLEVISNDKEISSAGYMNDDMFVRYNVLNQKMDIEKQMANDLRHDFNEFATIRI